MQIQHLLNQVVGFPRSVLVVFDSIDTELAHCAAWQFLFACLFVWGLTSHSRIFHSYGDVTITDEGLQILTYVRPLWQLSSEDSLACHPLL